MIVEADMWELWKLKREEKYTDLIADWLICDFTSTFGSSSGHELSVVVVLILLLWSSPSFQNKSDWSTGEWSVSTIVKYLQKDIFFYATLNF